MKRIDNNMGAASIVTNNYFSDPQCKKEFERAINELEEKELLIVGLTDIIDLQARTLKALLPDYQSIFYERIRERYIQEYPTDLIKRI